MQATMPTCQPACVHACLVGSWMTKGRRVISVHKCNPHGRLWGGLQATALQCKSLSAGDKIAADMDRGAYQVHCSFAGWRWRRNELCGIVGVLRVLTDHATAWRTIYHRVESTYHRSNGKNQFFMSNCIICMPGPSATGPSQPGQYLVRSQVCVLSG